MRQKCSLPLRETEGTVCSEFVMCYPPGIPIVGSGRTHHVGNLGLYRICQGKGMQYDRTGRSGYICV